MPFNANRSTIFDDLNENALTTVFGNLLEQERFSSVRMALKETLPQEVQEKVDLFDITSVEMHRGGRGNGIPDLVIQGERYVLVVEIKVKLYTDLTRYQANAYKSWTEEKILDEQTGFVAFLIPSGYNRFEELKAMADGSATNDRVRILPPITWNKLLTQHNNQFGPPEKLSNELIREFFIHLSEKFVPKPIEFSNEGRLAMHSKETAKGILDLFQIVENVTNQIKIKNTEAEISVTNLRQSSNHGGSYGYDFSNGEGSNVWFGIWWPCWAKHGFPLCIATPKSIPQSIDRNFREKYDEIEELEDEGGPIYLVAGFKLPVPNQDCGELIETIVNDIENLLH